MTWLFPRAVWEEVGKIWFVIPVNVARLELGVLFQTVSRSFRTETRLSETRVRSLKLFGPDLVDVALPELDLVHRLEDSSIVFGKDVGC